MGSISEFAKPIPKPESLKNPLSLFSPKGKAVSESGYTITPIPTCPVVISIATSQLLIIFPVLKAWSKSVSSVPSGFMNKS